MQSEPANKADTFESRLLLAAVLGLIALHLGCSPSPGRSGGRPATVATGRVLSTGEAATLAARLANDQCERQYRTRPFLPEQYPAVLQERAYRWGGLDVGGPRGFSALVTFRGDGTQPHVEVYFSSDALRPQKLPVVPREAAPGVK
jgi:hypothetical protein